METDKTHNDLHLMDSIKALLDGYFDATLSPIEMERLESVARDVADGKAHCPDSSMEADLRLIYSMSVYGTAILQNAGDSMPVGLENRLNAHISHLASQSSEKRHSFARKISTLCAAAAAVAVIMTAGFIYFSSPAPLPSAEILIADATPSPSVEALTRPAPAAATTNPNLSAAPKAANNHFAKTAYKKKQNVKWGKTPPRELQQEADNALKGLPAFAQDALAMSEEAFQVMPSGIEAYVETSELLVMPISTLSQSINNIYESVEIVSEAFSGVSTALAAANNSLALLSNPLGHD